ncbi:hypothetical protein AGMMS50212_00640 [Spirochaetia bacterium]|nr:hypothetical protein AGMMS50212_00640 [Spirochaetia bacterium]
MLCVMCGSDISEVNLPDPYYINGDKREVEILQELFSQLSKDQTNDDERFTLVREIANEYKRRKEYGRLINFLNMRVGQYPEDPYNTYYLFMIAFGYTQQESYSVAALYYNLILKNYPDLIVKGQSIHLVCLQQLINFENNPQQKIWYYEKLISNFNDQIDLGVSWFMLGQTYEQIGEWNKAIQAYTQFLPYYGTIIPGFPDAYGYAKQIVDFNNSSKNWTFESLGTLVSAIKGRLDDANSWRLWQYRARVNFFARSWAQVGSDDSGMAEFNLSSFRHSENIRYADDISADSNANEAYLKTWGWSQFTPIWYFYFRKIYFPADPEIHGRWEWAGVYYGERF